MPEIDQNKKSRYKKKTRYKKLFTADQNVSYIESRLYSAFSCNIKRLAFKSEFNQSFGIINSKTVLKSFQTPKGKTFNEKTLKGNF